MAIKTIPLSRLETDLRKTLTECAESGDIVVVEMPDQRLLAIQSLEAQEEDSLIDELLASNPKFQAVVARSKASPRKPFAVQGQD
jgi:SOS-response transcriptional repressor LexA